MKTNLLAVAPLAVLAALSACSNEPIQVGSEDPQANLVKNLPAAAPTPSIKSARTYRCKDNSLVYISFMSDDVTALVRDKEEEPPRATLTAPAPGQPFEGSGYSITGSGDTITYKSPDSGTQSCRA